jgi:hypothetical protein
MQRSDLALFTNSSRHDDDRDDEDDDDDEDDKDDAGDNSFR